MEKSRQGLKGLKPCGDKIVKSQELKQGIKYNGKIQNMKEKVPGVETVLFTFQLVGCQRWWPPAVKQKEVIQSVST